LKKEYSKVKIYVSKAIEGYDDGVIALLDLERKKKVERLKHEKEKLRSISAGLLLRYAYLEENKNSVDWKNIRIKEGQYGKPYIEGDETFKYSLSHSGDYVLCAIDSDEIGADIQETKSYKMGMAKRFFHESEYSRLNECLENDRLKEFYSIWTAKESAVKYSGRGMGEGIEHIVTNDSYSVIKNTSDGEELKIRLYDEIKGYMVCVCSKGNKFPDGLRLVGGLIC
jgi:4'-phosphopantetheinyl transferase